MLRPLSLAGGSLGFLHADFDEICAPIAFYNDVAYSMPYARREACHDVQSFKVCGDNFLTLCCDTFAFVRQLMPPVVVFSIERGMIYTFILLPCIVRGAFSLRDGAQLFIRWVSPSRNLSRLCVYAVCIVIVRRRGLAPLRGIKVAPR